MPRKTPSKRRNVVAELLTRRRVRHSYGDWVGLALVDYVPAQHHRLLIDKLQGVEDGRIPRLMIFMPPGTAKSTYGSQLFPPHFVGRWPKKCIILASYGSRLSKRFGKRCRDLVGSRLFRRTFGFGLARGSKAKDEWETEAGGEFVATSVDGSVTGRRADLILIDDPVKGRKEADSLLVRDGIWSWWLSDLRTRLKPNGAIVIIMCMTGDTPVLMEDGTEKPLRDVRPGDRVATYDGGRLATSTVRNWANQGRDRVFTIRMASGTIVRANARHPFLVTTEGGTEWRRTATLKPGDKILRATGESGAASRAQRQAAASLQSAEAGACSTTTGNAGQTESGHLRSILARAVKRACATATASVSLTMRLSWRSRAAFAPSASSRPATTCAPIGAASSASIIAPTAGTSEACSATTAISPSDTAGLKRSFAPPLTTFAITHDTVIDVVESGCEDVFDIQVDRTENFIAGGLVSHNTRWHEDDLAGRILPMGYDGQSGQITARDGEVWEVISIRAEAEKDDPLGRKPGEWLWPEWFVAGMLEHEKVVQGPRNWNALYQQRPSPEDGDYFRKDWLRWYEEPPARHTLKIYGSSDYAVTADGGDYTVHLVVGVDPNDDLYILDLWRQQTTSDGWVEAFIELVRRWRPLHWAEENGQILKSVGPFLEKRLRETRTYIYREQFPSAADKPTRAQAIRGRFAMRKVYLPRSAPWVPPLVAEMMAFPTGTNDDQVDTLSLIGRLLNSMIKGKERAADQPMRGANEMTLDEAWEKLIPKKGV